MKATSVLIASDLAYYTFRWAVFELPRLLLGFRRRTALLEAASERVQALKQQPTQSPEMEQIAVVIPCLNEEKGVERAVLSALSEEGVEVVVVDGGSVDQSRAVCAELGVRVLEGKKLGCRCRADAMNMGAKATMAPLLLFLHADTVLPQGYGAEVRGLQSRGAGVGAFRLAFGEEGTGPAPGLLLRFICWCANLRSDWLKLPYGDQALFMRRDVFVALGGYVSQPLLEDVDLVTLAYRVGLPVETSRHMGVVTSGRRWEVNGTLRNTVLNQAVMMGRAVGVPVERLAVWYRGS